MRDRGFIKWKPFNAVVPSSYLKNEEKIKEPSLSESEILEYEELLKLSLFTGISLEITYLKNNKKETIKRVVKQINSINQNIYFTDNTYINFRQIYVVKKK